MPCLNRPQKSGDVWVLVLMHLFVITELVFTILFSIHRPSQVPDVLLCIATLHIVSLCGHSCRIVRVHVPLPAVEPTDWELAWQAAEGRKSLILLWCFHLSFVAIPFAVFYA